MKKDKSEVTRQLSPSMTKVMIDGASQRSGLSVSTVRELLDSGYMYVDKINEPLTWVRQW